uniref:Fatty acyl-CoA reductase n=1 Tax=Timema monikensis TaxID=170555 RepID=A0A7R9DYZ1_9NEOP|nr:unnamed protein product [Timema monikensis]
MPDHIVILHSGLSQKVVQIQEKMTTPSSYTPVSQFYQDRAILVTGGTGFMGKVLVEKLLRSCPGIRNIYLLIRPKRGKDVSSRMSDLLQAPLFNNIRKDQPQALNKIIPIPGDIMQPELGISQFDQNILIREVSVVFHSAATVKFDEMLKQSVNINMLGTKRLVQLCHRILGLEALIHVSTAYCNCDRPEVDEVIYSPPYDPEHIIQCMEWMDDDLVNTVTPKLIGNRPNTYTFTKALAESMLMKECGNLPVAIVRPSIVLSSAREPLAGWIDNWNGPSGIIGATSKGIFRTILCDPNKVADLIPVDFVVNLLVCAAWKTATTRSDDIAVYNCCTGLQNPITWKQFVDYSFHHIRRHPLVDTMWYPDGAMHSCSTINTVCTFFLHFLPAHIVDFFTVIAGKKPFMASIQNKLSTAAVCLHYFTTQQWIFNDDKVRQLSSLLSVEDKKCFSFDVREIDWPTYIESYILGMRQFLFKEKPSSLPTARKKLRTSTRTVPSWLLEGPGSWLFNRIRKEQPLAVNKVIPIEGDITRPDLGISLSDQNVITRMVSVVFHSAATVRFDEVLKVSVETNMVGTKQLVQLCHRILKLEALVHVSTAYSNCDRPEVDEVIYSPPYDPEHIIQCMEWMDDDLVNTVTPKLIGNRPNTYTFTKALAESMLMKECGNLPVAIVRPSIILSCAREPEIGWLDNVNGPTVIIAATAKGFFRTILCHEDKKADLIPVDMVTNLTICVAWRTATTKSDNITVYNCSSGVQNPITWKQFVDCCFLNIRKHPLEDMVWYPDGTIRSNSLVNSVCSTYMHFLPAHIIDILSRVFGKKPFMVNIQTKLSKASKFLKYFSTRQWHFNDDNTRELSSILSEDDKRTFSFDVREIHWPTYIESYILGVRQFIFKEHPSSLPLARKQLLKYAAVDLLVGQVLSCHLVESHTN